VNRCLKTFLRILYPLPMASRVRLLDS